MHPFLQKLTAAKPLHIALAVLVILIVCSLAFSKQREGMAVGNVESNGAVLTAPNGDTVVFASKQVTVAYADGRDDVVYVVDGDADNDGRRVYVGPYGARLAVTWSDGEAAIVFSDGDGNLDSDDEIVYVNRSSGSSYDVYTGDDIPEIFYGPDGGTARVVNSGSEKTIIVTDSDGATTTYYVDTTDGNVYYDGHDGKIVIETGDTTKLVVTAADGTVVVFTSDNNSYVDDVTVVRQPQTVSEGLADADGAIPRSAIPPGDEDLYMLKSQALVPICPRCPAPIVVEGSGKEKCPPCPAPARCPEPQFECTKTFTGSSLDESRTPVPLMTSFTSFGM